ncbi:hypothetical protein AAMO2058_001112100 [Amorphochlora amoebiformis]
MRVRSLWRKLVQAGPMAGRNGGLSPYRPNFSPSAVRLFSKQQKEQAKRNKESTKKKKKKKGKTEERWAPNPELLQAQIDLLKPEQPHEKWFEDRTKEQVEMDTFYYKEIQRRNMKERNRLNGALSKKIRSKVRAVEALPAKLKKEARKPLKEPFPFEIGPWTETPPIPGFDPTKTLAFQNAAKMKESRSGRGGNRS